MPRRTRATRSGFTARVLAEQAGGAIDVTDPSVLPEWTLSWVGIGFRKDDPEFRSAFNAALKDSLGTDEMLAGVAEYGYTDQQLPGDVTMEYACANR